jgi:hypothetical protein
MEKQFRNVPPKKMVAMERCVQDVKRQGRTKKQAIAICFNSIVGKEIGMSSSKSARKKRRASKRKDLQAIGRAKEKALAEVEESFAPIDNPEQQQEVLEAIEEIAEEEYEEEPEKSKSSHLVEMPSGHMHFGGAQSWDDLAEFRTGQNKTEAVRQTEFEFRKMVDNILEDPELEMDDKGNMIASLAEGFPSQVDATTEANKELEDPGLVDSILAKIGVKQVTKREAGANFKASDFADVPDAAKPSTWKLRLAEGQSGNFTVAQVARAITAMQPSGFRGQRVKLGTAKSSVASKISGAINKIKGATPDQKRTLRERLAKVKSTGFVIEKDLQGNFRWLGWVSNKWRDRDIKAHPQGEILAEASHKEFIDWVYEKADERMPELWLWHTFGTAMKSGADWLDYADGYLLESGKLTEAEAVMLTKMADEYDLAMSHSFLRLGYDKETGVITQYRSFESSVLPREHVANEWTDFATFSKEDKEMFSEERRKFLIDALGEERVSELEESTGEMAKELKAMGIEFKEKAEDEKPKEKEKEAAKGTSVVNVNVDTDELIEKIGLVALSDLLQKQDETIKALTEKIAELSKTDDEKIAKKMTPKAAKSGLFWLEGASKSEDNILDKDDEKDKELGDSKPGDKADGSWLAEAHEIPAADAVPRS